jgi:hypothetical protein
MIPEFETVGFNQNEVQSLPGTLTGNPNHGMVSAYVTGR